MLVHYRHHVVLPHELILSFGMRKFFVLITDNRLPFPTFLRDLEKYVLQSKIPEVDLDRRSENTHVRKEHEVSQEPKEKEVMDGQCNRQDGEEDYNAWLR